jgi:hypothetical protein
MVAGAIIAVVGVWLGGPLLAQSGRTVLEGVFTEAQAMRGEASYSTNCAECHEGADVDGPSLEGTPFIDRWREDTLDVLFTFLKTKMPADQPGKLGDAAYLDILARLLKLNDYPSGAKDLTVETVASTRLVGKDGPKPLPTNAVVQLVGCLIQRPDGTWAIANAGDLSRASIADQTTAEEQEKASAKALGSRTYRLQNLADVSGFAPDSRKGQKVFAKGVIIRQTNNDRINATALAAIGPSCAP